VPADGTPSRYPRLLLWRLWLGALALLVLVIAQLILPGIAAQRLRDRGWIAAALASNAVGAPVDTVFPLGRAADAYDHVRAPGRFGKTLLELGG